MREGAVLTALDPAVGIAEVPAAAVAQRIERAVAEQAVKVLLLHAPVAGEERTAPVLEEALIPLNIRFHIAEKGVVAARLHAVELFDICGREDLFRPADAVNGAVPHTEHRVGDARGTVELVQRQHDRDLLFPCQFLQHRQKLDLIAHVEEGGRLVQQQDLRLLADGAGKHHALALAVTDFLKALGGKLAHMDQGHGLPGRRAVLLREDAEPARIGIAPRRDHLGTAHELGAQPLGGHDGQASGKLVFRHAGERLPIQKDGAGYRLQPPCEGFQDRGFPRAVGPDEGQDLPRAEGEGKSFQDGLPAVAHGQVVGLQDDFMHRSALPFSSAASL